MSRILWQPDKWLGQCSVCETTMEFDKNELTPHTIFGQIAKCPNCKHGNLYLLKQDPTIVVTDGNCKHCGSKVAQDDKHCNQCGAPL